ncbi:MAG: nucleoside monophosphate kinase [Candidatus Spechtbacterales bacterium]|nr:nucleoside monophosphate kinase [Candidatus Spechtbacterales bacterium]
MKLNSPIAVMVMGRPGAGKDTQADYLAEYFNLIRISTSEIIKKKLNSDSDDPALEKEREIFNSGVLNTPSWVLSVIKEHVEDLQKKDFEGKNGIIFSGSPRTLYEAENMIPFIEDIFGQDNIFAFNLEVSDDIGLKRIRERNKENPRELDTGEDKLKIRTKEFYERTKPGMDVVEEKGYLITVDGNRTPEEISNEVTSILESKLKQKA